MKAVVQGWEETVKRVASKEIGEKVEKRRGGGMVRLKRKLGWGDRFIRRLVVAGKYYKLHLEIKELVCKKKLNSWNEVIEKATKDFYENRKEFWAFVGRTPKGSRKGIASLRSTSGSCEISTMGKLEVLREHY